MFLYFQLSKIVVLLVFLKELLSKIHSNFLKKRAQILSLEDSLNLEVFLK